jgi:hypothetical protein
LTRSSFYGRFLIDVPLHFSTNMVKGLLRYRLIRAVNAPIVKEGEATSSGEAIRTDKHDSRQAWFISFTGGEVYQNLTNGMDSYYHAVGLLLIR